MSTRSRSDARDPRMVEYNIRLRPLYEISKLLTIFESVEHTVPAVIALLARALPIRSAIFILTNGQGRPRTIVWQAEGESLDRLRVAKAHARTALGYLLRSDLDLGGHQPEAQQSLGRDVREGESAPPVEQSFILLPLVIEQQTIFGALQLEGAGPFDEMDLIFVNAVVNQMAIALDRHAVIEAKQAAAQASEKEQRLLARVSAVVGFSLEYRGTLEALARAAVPQFADLCLIDEVGEDGTVARLEVIFADETKQRDLADQMRRFSPQPGWRTAQAAVLASGESLLFGTVTDPLAEGIAHDQEDADTLRAAGINSLMAVPLLARGKTLGALTFAAAESGRRYSTRDLAVAEEIAHRAAIAIDNAQLYEQAQRATRGREDLLAIVSHDLNNPLAVIGLNIDMLLKHSRPEERRKYGRKQLELIDRAVTRMTGLLRDLLDTASIEAGHLSIERALVPVVQLVTEALEAVQPLAAKKRLRLESDLGDDLPAVFADADRIQQVLINLLGNAIKFTGKGRSITVRAERLGDAVRLSVADTGAGIAEGDLRHLFDRFWQAQGTARAGTGLGLFIARGIVEAHRGTISVESKLGEGSTFSFTLPDARADPERLVDAPATSRSDEAPRPRPEADGALRAEAEPRAVHLQQLAEEQLLRARELHAALDPTAVVSGLAERAARLKRDFLTLASHEFRDPLTVVELLVERMQRDREDPPAAPQQEIIRQISAALTRLDVSLEFLLHHALLERGRLAVEIETFDLYPLVAATVEELRPYAEGKGLKLLLTAAAGLSPLTSDHELVRLILSNLLGNAIKFTESGSVELRIDRVGGAHRLVVKDSGPGIPPGERIRIFDPVGALADVRQRRLPGMGLGLSLVRELASALGGDIELDSEVGVGSTFTVIIPPASQPSPSLQPAEEEAAPPH
jgi:signal transduction histidine kinase